MSRGWQTILIKQKTIPIWDLINDYLSKDFNILEHNAETLAEFGRFLKDNRVIFTEGFKILVINESSRDWVQLLWDRSVTQGPEKEYLDLPDRLYSSGVLSFISDLKLDAFWYGFVDEYYWWYEVFQTGQVKVKQYSDKGKDKIVGFPKLLNEIFQGSTEKVLGKNMNDKSPEDSIKRINQFINFPIIENILPISYISGALNWISSRAPKTENERYLDENFGGKTRLILYR